MIHIGRLKALKTEPVGLAGTAKILEGLFREVVGKKGTFRHPQIVSGVASTAYILFHHAVPELGLIPAQLPAQYKRWEWRSGKLAGIFNRALKNARCPSDENHPGGRRVWDVGMMRCGDQNLIVIEAVRVTVHCLHQGFALCGFGSEGVPRDWSPRHVWVGVNNWRLVTCPKCLAAK